MGILACEDGLRPTVPFALGFHVTDIVLTPSVRPLWCGVSRAAKDRTRLAAAVISGQAAVSGQRRGEQCHYSGCTASRQSGK